MQNYFQANFGRKQYCIYKKNDKKDRSMFL